MSDDFRPRMHITEEDLLGDGLDQRVEQMKAAQSQPLVQPVGAPKGPGMPAPRPVAGGGNWFRSTAATLGLAGLVGGPLGWVPAEFITQPDADHPWYGDSPTVATILFMSLFAVILGAVIAAWDGIELRDWVKARGSALRAAPYLLGGAIVGAAIGQQIFKSMMENALESADSFEGFKSSLHLARGLFFAICAGAIGLALGAYSKSSKRAVNGAIGGVVGGFIGGFLFDFIGDPETTTSGLMPRLIALAITGVTVGVAIGLIETARREHWLEIVSGGMAGKQFILYHDQTTVGSASDCQITLIKDPGIAPAHIILVRQGQGLAMHPAPGVPVLVNGMASGPHTLADGDLVQAGSTVLRYRSKASATPLPGAIH